MEHGPHVGGPVDALGCDAVLVEGRAAARGGDTALCAVATDVVMKGSATVWIGRMPAARFDEPCFHGGRIVGGARQVFIGGPDTAPPNIDAIVANTGEIDEIRRQLALQSARMDKLREYVAGPPDVSPEVKILLDFLKKQGQHGAPSMPPGWDNFDDEEARELGYATAEMDALAKKMMGELDRIRELERQNREHQKGRPMDSRGPR
jgi:uncharacterized Zn-binding protein involved in type VI secretion